MYCLRCGKETADNKVFCGSCLESMEEYPVKPGQPILLPNRPAPVPARKSRKSKVFAGDELLDQLRHQLKVTGRLWLITILLLVAAIVVIALQWQYGLLLPN